MSIKHSLGCLEQASALLFSDDEERDLAIRVALIPPERWKDTRAGYLPQREPDTFEVFREMENHGVKVEIVDPSRFFAYLTRRYGSFYTGLDPLRALGLVRQRKQIDLILSVFESSSLWPLLARGLPFSTPKVGIWDIAPNEQWAVRRRSLDFAVPRVDHVFLLSEFQKNYLQHRHGRRHGISVVYQHIDTCFYQPVSGQTREVVLAIGEDFGRDFETFLAAVRDLDVDVIIKTRRPLRLTSGRARITQIKDRVSHLALRKLYAEAALVVVPLHETLNVSGVGSVLEASAMAKPLVVSDNPVLRDYFVPDETALAVPVGDVDRMAGAIRLLLSNKHLAARLGASARAFVEARFSNAVFARRMAHEIHQAMAHDTSWTGPGDRGSAAPSAHCAFDPEIG